MGWNVRRGDVARHQATHTAAALLVWVVLAWLGAR